MQRLTEAIKIICTVVNTLYPIPKDLRNKKADQSGTLIGKLRKANS